MDDFSKAAVIGVPILGIIFFIILCYCCCCRSRPSSQGAVIMAPGGAPAPVMVTSTNAIVPMRPLANEA